MLARYSDFFKGIAGIDVRMGLPMKNVSSFRIGGPANVIFPRSCEELIKIIRTAKETGTELLTLGNGTNVLVRDEGISEPVLMMNVPFEGIRLEGNEFTAPAGMLFGTFAKETVKRGYMGLEWANGIPGTVGGALAMNAGAYGGEVRNSLKRVCYIEDGEVIEAEPSVKNLSYRKSDYCAPKRISLSATFELKKDDGGAEERMLDYAHRRIEKQPLKYPSAGSVFKRPEGNFAGALIEAAGLKGRSVGGAQVSELHAGFIINKGGATCADVLELIKIIQETVYKNSGVRLETEIKLIGSEAEN